MSYMKRLFEEEQNGCDEGYGDTSYLDEEFRSVGVAGEVPARAAQEDEIPEPCNFVSSITEDSLA